jgi:hypothetical protein
MSSNMATKSLGFRFGSMIAERIGRVVRHSNTSLSRITVHLTGFSLGGVTIAETSGSCSRFFRAGLRLGGRQPWLAQSANSIARLRK